MPTQLVAHLQIAQTDTQPKFAKEPPKPTHGRRKRCSKLTEK